MCAEMKRVKITLKNPNPLFEKWLQEWKNEAAAKNSDMKHCFGKALMSLRKYPLPLQSGRECGILQNFGKTLCAMLDKKLEEYKLQHPEGLLLAEHNANTLIPKVLDAPVKKRETYKVVVPDVESEIPTGKRRTVKSLHKKRDYIPEYRSGAYAILLALLDSQKKEDYQGFVKKMELQRLAQPLCDVSFTKPERGSYYTAWASVSTLSKKGLVTSVGKGMYTLSEEGVKLAEKLVSIQQPPTQHDQPSCPLPPKVSRKPNVSDVHNEESIFPPGSFDVILLVDTQEISGRPGQRGKLDFKLHDFLKHNITAEVRHLTVGDFLWICRDRNSGKEVVLPYIVERKRVDDFAQSIIDSRYHEQKFRLKQCGIPNLIYLVEKLGKCAHTPLPSATLNQASTNTEVVDGFIVKYTDNHKESTNYLVLFTRFLQKIFETKTLVMCEKKDVPDFSLSDDLISLMSFSEFNSSSQKNTGLQVRDMFITHLVQLNGLSVEKALAIVDKYPTPYILYSTLKQNEDVTLLSEIAYGYSNRKIGLDTSKIISDLYVSDTLL